VRVPHCIRRRPRDFDGAEVTTVESLENAGQLIPVQHAFVAAGAFQCGYCAPGFVIMTTKLLEQYPHPDKDTIKHYLAGNLCWCATYPEVLDAVRLAVDICKARKPSQGKNMPNLVNPRFRL
jgi:aerobic-type carbon monoxide dehydrogenase small subunit (CoxS/CutS family)